MFGTILILVLTGQLLYVVWRTSQVPLIARRVGRKALVVVGAAVWIVLVLSRVFGHHGVGVLAAGLEFAGMTLLGTLFLVSTALLVADLGTGFGRLLPGRAPAIRGWALVAGLVLSSISLVQGNRAPAVSSHEVTLASLPRELDGVVVVAVSDTHLGPGRKEQWFDDRVAEVARLRPDVVVFLGDIFEGHGEIPRDIASLQALDPPLGKWFVEGNHEVHHDGRTGSDVLQRAGFRGLVDASARVATGLVFAGVQDLSHHMRSGLGGDPLEKALADRPDGAAVLLSHTPWQADRAAREGVELMLSAHTHGGQIWPFGLLVRVFYPLSAGRYEVDGMPVIVCRGTGTWGPPMRLWQRSEILRITLRSGRARSELAGARGRK